MILRQALHRCRFGFYLALAALLTGCTLIGNGPVFWNKFYSGSYSYSTFTFLTRKSPALLQIAGIPQDKNPDEVKARVRQSILANHRMYGLDAVTEPQEDTEQAVRFLIVFSPRKDLNATAACRKTDEDSDIQDLSGGEPNGLFVAYCKRDLHMSSVQVTLPSSAAMDEQQLQDAIRQAITFVLLPYNPEKGRSCSTTVTTDC